MATPLAKKRKKAIAAGKADKKFAKTVIKDVHIAKKFKCVGLAPMNNGHKMNRFIFTASRTPYQPSGISSILLEMIGGRFDLSITSNSVYK